jgi:hypothetical protein
MTRIIAISLLSACAVRSDPAPVGPDLDLAAVDLSMALESVRPDPLLAWALEPHTIIDTTSGCPAITRVDQDEGTLEHWEGGCVQPDGTRIEGRLSWFDGPATAWAAGEGFSIIDAQGLVRHLDGAVEVTGEGALWLAEANATTCVGEVCAEGTSAVDLTYTIHPAAGYPHDYDLTVSGVVAPRDDAGAIVIDGAWSVEETTCAIEPVRGLIAIQRADHQTLTLNGASACDECAAWVVQGRDAPAYCGRIR